MVGEAEITSLPVGLVGLGKWGRKIARTIRDEVPGLALAAVASANTEAAKILGPDVAIHRNWQELVESGVVRALVLAVPPALNRDIAMYVLRKGLPLFIEKPLALNVADAMDILACAEKYGVIADVDHVDLHNPGIVALQNHVDAPIRVLLARIGADYPRRSDMSPLWEYAPHMVAVILKIIARPPLGVMAHEQPSEIAGSGHENTTITLDYGDETDIRLVAGNGMARKYRSVTIDLGDRSLHFDDRSSIPLLRRDHNTRVETGLPVASTLPLTAALRAFEAKLRKGVVDVEGVRTGLAVTRILAAASRARETGKWVAL